MTKKLVTKIISIMMAVLLFTQAISPLQASAAVLNYDHPNGSNPYKLKTSDVVNPEIFMSVVSCTGIVNKVAGAIQNVLSDLLETQAERAKKKAIKAAAKKTAKAATNALTNPATPSLNVTAASLVDDLYADVIPTEDEAAQQAIKARDCLNGIAIQLARNQLTKMTKDTMNWVTSGFNGNPFFVGEVNSFMGNLTDDIIIKETNLLKCSNPDPSKCPQLNSYPYGKTFAQNLTSMMQRAVHSTNMYAQNLTDHIILGDGETSQDAINRFATDFSQGGLSDPTSFDFSEGGWGGWLSLTMFPQNNPLGFTAIESRKISEQQTSVVVNTGKELDQGNGYLSDKRCIEWQEVNKDGKPIYDEDGAEVITNSSTNNQGIPNICVKYQTVTPGNTIRGKIDKYINSAETQLELVRTIDDALNNLFSALLGRLFEQGLVGLSPEKNVYDSFATNSQGEGGFLGDNGGISGSFDITNAKKMQDLINTQQEYIDATNTSLKTVLPFVASAVGELDYCIPGPNPNWQNNSSEAINNLDDYLGNLRSQTVNITITKCSGVSKFFGCEDLKQELPLLSSFDPTPYKDTFNNLTLWKMVKDIFNNIPTNSIKLFPDKDIALGPYKANGTTITVEGSDSALNNKDIIIASESYVETKVKRWTSYIKNIKPEYIKKINELYGQDSIMQTAFDADGNLDESGYLRMAQAGLSITKNLKTLNETIEDEKDYYKKSIAEANANKFKIKQISDQVQKILITARKRRDSANLKYNLPAFPKSCFDTEIINITGNNCVTNTIEKVSDGNGGMVTKTIVCDPRIKS